MNTMIRSALVLLAVAGLVACGDDDDTVSSRADAPPPAASACLEGSTECDDDPTSTADDSDDAIDEGAAIEEARGLLGLAEDELDASVRIARAGDEQYALTADYVIGRMTVELDPDEDDTMRVTSVVIELTDGPLTVTE
jgi:hypothetical protein